jgi:hypothetical protein
MESFSAEKVLFILVGIKLSYDSLLPTKELYLLLIPEAAPNPNDPTNSAQHPCVLAQ